MHTAARIVGKKAGTFGDSSSFSFYPTKIITSGEGGIIVTDSDRMNEESRLYRDQGKATFTANIHNKLGYNWRMSEPHAIIGLQHFRHLPAFIEERNRLARVYDRTLAGGAGRTPLDARRRKRLELLQVHRDAGREDRPCEAEEGPAREIRCRSER